MVVVLALDTGNDWLYYAWKEGSKVELIFADGGWLKTYESEAAFREMFPNAPEFEPDGSACWTEKYD